MNNPFDELKVKVDSYEDPMQKIAFMDGVISYAIAIAEVDGEEIPPFVRKLQKVFNLLHGILDEAEKSSS